MEGGNERQLREFSSYMLWLAYLRCELILNNDPKFRLQDSSNSFSRAFPQIFSSSNSEKPPPVFPTGVFHFTCP